jgi:uncharacterized delta-60 repeat protein
MRKCRSSDGGHHVQSLEPRYLFAAGDVDTTFGDAGRIDHIIPSEIPSLRETLFLPGGKILMGGSARYLRLAPQDQLLFRRFNLDGSLDPTFAVDGTLLANFTTSPADDSRLDAFAVGPDGKIWAAGEADLSGPGGGFFLARFTANGHLDTTFGGGTGSVLIPQRVPAMRIQPDGKPVLLTGINGTTISRYLADGTLDPSFGGGHGAVESPGGDVLTVVRFQGDGKILLGGLGTDNTGIMRFAIARLNVDGTPDTTFSGDGVDLPVVAGSGTQSNSVGDIALLPGGKILVSGGTLNDDPQRGGFVAVRYNANGTIDTTYGTVGATIVPFGNTASPGQLIIDVDGNTYLAGNGHDGLIIARLTADGDLDETFGRVITFGSGLPDISAESFGGTQTGFSGAGLDADGKLIVAGQRQLAGPEDQNVLDHENFSFFIRYLTEDDGLPSPVTLDGAQHVMSVAGTDGADFIEAAEVGDVVYASRGGYGRAFDIADVARVAITGGDGNDIIATPRLTTVPASVVGGLGADRIAGGEAGDRLEGSGGNDAIDGNGGADLIIGGNGHDVLLGFAGDDTLAGAAGNDELRGGAGNDTYDGGPGTDTIVDLDIPDLTLVAGVLKYYDRDNSDDQISFIPDGNGNLIIYVNGATNTVDLTLVSRIEVDPTGGDDFVRVYQGLNIPAILYGGLGGETSSGGNDTLIGGAANDSLFGFEGDDVLFGNGGNDYLEGSSGSDVMHGNAGRDTVNYSYADIGIVVSLDGVRDDGVSGENDLAFSDIERVIGSFNDDRIGGSSADNILYGGPGDDTLGGGGGSDALYGAEGNDKLDGGDGDDYLEGGAGHDLLHGGAGADQLFALAGNDTLLSDDGVKDTVRGGTGVDTGDVDELDDVLAVESLI